MPLLVAKKIVVVLLASGVISGLAVGFVWYQILASSESDVGMLLALCGLGVFQAVLVFGCHWLAGKLHFTV